MSKKFENENVANPLSNYWLKIQLANEYKQYTKLMKYDRKKPKSFNEWLKEHKEFLEVYGEEILKNQKEIVDNN